MPEDEQLLLGLAIRSIMENPSIGREKLRGGSFENDFKLHVLLSTRLDEGTLARFWGSLNQPIRPAITWTDIGGGSATPPILSDRGHVALTQFYGGAPDLEDEPAALAQADLVELVDQDALDLLRRRLDRGHRFPLSAVARRSREP